MKKLLRRSWKPPPAGTPVIAASTGPSPAHTLPPKFTAPPIPHPCPYAQIGVLATPEGLLLWPVVEGLSAPLNYIQISWGTSLELRERDSEDAVGVDWTDGAVVHGVLGLTKLWAAAYLLVVTSVTEVGNALDPSYTVYGVKALAAIPLQESSAQVVINTIISRKHEKNEHTHSIIPRTPRARPAAGSSMLAAKAAAGTSREGMQSKVKFSDTDDVKMISPRTDKFPADDVDALSVASSGTTTPTSDSDMTTPIAKVLASRLSFWSKVPSRRSFNPLTMSEDEPLKAGFDEQRLTDEGEEPEAVIHDLVTATAPTPKSAEDKHTQLEDKVLKELIKEYTKGAMYFSYAFDITTSLQRKQSELSRQKRREGHSSEPHHGIGSSDDDLDLTAEPNPTLPQWRRVDRRFWWNEGLLQPFIDGGFHPYVLPVMQGFCQIASFSIPREPEVNETGDSAVVEYIIISRRSRNRAGLRYQRRGIDDEASVANFVETETIMRVEREGVKNTFSYIQIRGSIPLFWAQASYGFKPAPILSADRTHADNLDAIRRHFSKSVATYGPHVNVNLAEQQGKEAAVTHAYRDYVKELAAKDVQYVEYDFHTETKGMKYENISKLTAQLARSFEAQGYMWVSGKTLMSEQKGVFRVNCIDCLDRTNVVQSAFARHVLMRQLGAVALLTPTASGPTEMDIVFNELWANNGDAISRAYAGTSALKGDFTRTGKRDLNGLMNDGMNSLARMYSSTFSDWFSQAVIDFMLGNRTLSVFSEFLVRLQSTDPSERLRLSKIRAGAIATSVSRVLPEGEALLSGWTLLSPVESGQRVSDKIEEKVLLLSAQALYIISFDYNLDKVCKYTRVPLENIQSITKGAYILSPLEEGSRDPLQNYGFVVSHKTSGQMTRITTYSVRNSTSMDDVGPPSPSQKSTVSSPASTSPRPLSKRQSSFFSRAMSNMAVDIEDGVTENAFKALPVDPARQRRTTGSFEDDVDELNTAGSCKEATEVVVNAIVDACKKGGVETEGLVKDDDVVGLEEAEKQISVYAKMEYGFKRLLWLGR